MARRQLRRSSRGRSMAIDVSLDADITAVMGATGSGKSIFIKSELRRRKPKRLLIYDPEGEYLAFGRQVEKLSDVLSVLLQCGSEKPFKLVFVPHADPARAEKQFELLCRAAFHTGRLLLVAEELADVTKPTYAPVGWGMASRRGRKRGVSIIGASQRPAQVDKAFLSGCTRVRCGRLLYEDDARAMAKVLGLGNEGIRELMGLESLHFIERVMPGEAVRGVMKI